MKIQETVVSHLDYTRWYEETEKGDARSLTDPSWANGVTMTTTRTFCSTIMRQKSSTVCCKGPCVMMYFFSRLLSYKDGKVILLVSNNT